MTSLSSKILFILMIQNMTYAGTQLSFLGQQTHTEYNSGGVIGQPLPTWGAGLLLETGRGQNSHWEVGVSYLQRQWSPDSSLSVVQFPVGYGFWLSRWFGLSTGFQYSYALSNITINSVSYEHSTGSFSKNDFGVYGSIKINLPLEISWINVHLSARYNYGLSNLSTQDGIQSKFNEWIVGVGFRFGSLGAGEKTNDNGNQGIAIVP